MLFNQFVSIADLLNVQLVGTISNRNPASQPRLKNRQGNHKIVLRVFKHEYNEKPRIARPSAQVVLLTSYQP